MSVTVRVPCTYLLILEDVLVEIILQVFISIINTELLKTVLVEVLKSEYVKNTNRVTLKKKGL